MTRSAHEAAGGNKLKTPFYHIAILANQELREVPLDITCQDATLLTFEVTIQRISCK